MSSVVLTIAGAFDGFYRPATEISGAGAVALSDSVWELATYSFKPLVLAAEIYPPSVVLTVQEDNGFFVAGDAANGALLSTLTVFASSVIAKWATPATNHPQPNRDHSGTAANTILTPDVGEVVVGTRTFLQSELIAAGANFDHQITLDLGQVPNLELSPINMPWRGPGDGTAFEHLNLYIQCTRPAAQAATVWDLTNAAATLTWETLPELTGLDGVRENAAQSRVDRCPKCGEASLRQDWIRDGWSKFLVCKACWDPKDRDEHRKGIRPEDGKGLNSDG